MQSISSRMLNYYNENLFIYRLCYDVNMKTTNSTHYALNCICIYAKLLLLLPSRLPSRCCRLQICQHSTEQNVLKRMYTRIYVIFNRRDPQISHTAIHNKYLTMKHNEH